MPANNIYNDIYIVLIVLMIYFVIKLICTIRTRKSRVFISNAPKNIFKRIIYEIKGIKDRREWREVAFAKKYCCVYKIKDTYKLCHYIHVKENGWLIQSEDVRTVSVNEGNTTLGNAVVETLMQTKVEKVNLKKYFSEEKKWLYRNFKLRSYKALHRSEICTVRLYNDELTIYPTKVVGEGKYTEHDEERKLSLSYSHIMPEDIGRIVSSL